MACFHLTALSRRETKLFHDHHEANALWRILLRTVPDPVAVCLMPDHVHLMHALDVSSRLRDVMSAYARWRNHAWGTSGPVWYPLEPAERVKRGKKLQRSVRYVHLNPCRKRRPLVPDPLAWPWSTHGDAVGLSPAPVVPPARDVRSFHRYVSSDPSVHVEGTDLPVTPQPGRHGFELGDLAEAYCALFRQPWPVLTRKGAHRARFLALARLACERPQRDLAAFCRVSRTRVSKVEPVHQPWMSLVLRVTADPRFRSVDAHDRAIAAYTPWTDRNKVD